MARASASGVTAVLDSVAALGVVANDKTKTATAKIGPRRIVQSQTPGCYRVRIAKLFAYRDSRAGVLRRGVSPQEGEKLSLKPAWRPCVAQGLSPLRSVRGG
jgi:hypothetical protein